MFFFNMSNFLRQILWVEVVLLSLAGGVLSIIAKKTPTLLALCSKDFIRVNIIMSHHNFFGIVYTRPNRNTCSVLGIGEKEITLYIPLAEPGRSDCGVALQDDFYSVVVDVREHHVVETAKDTSFLVQCSATESSQLSDSPKAEMKMEILKDDQPVRQTVVGELYTVQLDLPNNSVYQVTSCIAFSGIDTIKFVPLMDSNGCPIEGVITPFFPVYGSSKVRAEITMFRFNDSNQFHVQCTVSKCGEVCIQPSCGKEKDGNLISSKILSQNSEEAFAAFRVSVIDQWQSLTIIKDVGCKFNSESGIIGLTILLILLITLTIGLCGFAAYNRPFKCHIQERDSVSINEELLQIVEEPQDVWSVLSKFRFLFPLALPSTQNLLISTLPSTQDLSSEERGGSFTQSQTKPIIQLEQSITPGSTLRSRKQPDSDRLSRESISPCQENHASNSTLDKEDGTSKSSTPPAPPPRIDSILKHPKIQSSPPLPPPPRETTEISSSESVNAFPPPPCLTELHSPMLGQPLRSVLISSRAVSPQEHPAYAVPSRGKQRTTNLSESTEYYMLPSRLSSRNDDGESERTYSLLSSFRNKKLLTKDIKIFFNSGTVEKS